MIVAIVVLGENKDKKKTLEALKELEEKYQYQVLKTKEIRFFKRVRDTPRIG